MLRLNEGELVAESDVDDRLLARAVTVLMPQRLREDRAVLDAWVDEAGCCEAGFNSGGDSVLRIGLGNALSKVGISEADIRQYASADEPVVLSRPYVIVGVHSVVTACLGCTWQTAYHTVVLTERQAKASGENAWRIHQCSPQAIPRSPS